MSDTTSPPPGTGTGFGDMLADPTTAALLGLAQGFGQAAMPTPYKGGTPLGAMIGMAAGGALKGVQGAQQYSMGREQLSKAQIENKRAKMLLDWYNGLPGGGSGQSGGGAGGAAPFGVPAAGGAGAPGQGYMLTPQQRLARSDIAMATGQDRAASSFISGYDSSAGGPGYTYLQNGNASFVPGGPHDPATIGKTTLARAVPEANVKLQTEWMQPRDQGGGIIGPMPGAPPQIGGAAGGAGAQASTTPQAATVAALASLPSDAARSAAINAAIKSNLPPEAWAPWIAAVHNESQWNHAIPNGAAGEIGIGQIMPATGKAMGYTPEQLAVPQTNLEASAKYFGQKWNEGRGDPRRAFAGYNSGAVTGNVPDYVGKGTARLAQWGYPGMQTPLAPGVTRQPMAGGGVQVTNTRPVMQQQYEEDRKDAGHATDDVMHAQTQIMRLTEMRNAVNGLPTGSGADARLAVATFLKTYFPPAIAENFLTRLAKLPDAVPAQEAAKLMLQSSGAQEREVLGGRGGFRAIQLFQRANPSLELLPDANRRIINMQMIAQQADVDYGRGLLDWVNTHGQNFMENKGAYQPATQYDQQWVNQRNPQVYAAAISALNGDPFAEWTKVIGSKSPEEIKRVIGIIQRTDPSARIMWDDGKPHTFAAAKP